MSITLDPVVRALPVAAVYTGIATVTHTVVELDVGGSDAIPIYTLADRVRVDGASAPLTLSVATYPQSITLVPAAGAVSVLVGQHLSLVWFQDTNLANPAPSQTRYGTAVTVTGGVRVDWYDVTLTGGYPRVIATTLVKLPAAPLLPDLTGRPRSSRLAFQ